MQSEEAQRANHVFRVELRKGAAQKDRRADRHRRQCATVARGEQHPTVEEGCEVSVGFADEHILSAGLGIHRAEFGAGQARDQSDAADHDPQQQRHRRIRYGPEDVGGHDEYGRADGAADNDHYGVEQRQLPLELRTARRLNAHRGGFYEE